MNFAYRIGILLTALAGTAPLWAQYAPLLWQPTGVPIRQGYHIEWQRSAEVDENGNVIYVWSDTRYGDRDVFAQKVNPAGDKLWGDDGALIVHTEGRQEDPMLIPTGFGDYIFIWNDFRTDTAKGDLYAQKINASGVPQWAETGVMLSDGNFDSPAQFRIVADGAGGAIILWQDLRNGDEGDVYAIRVLGDGTVPAPWAQNGTLVVQAPGGQREITVDTDGAGGAIIAWADGRTTGQQGRDIYIQRVTINGELAWGSSGVIVCQALADQTGPKLCPDGSGGAYLVWYDQRDDFFGDIYFQHVSSTGTLLLPETNGRVLVNYTNSKQEKPRIIADGSGNAIIIWLDNRNDPYDRGIYAQKIDGAGHFLWGAEGVVVAASTMTEYPEARLAAYGAGAICSWVDERTLGNKNLYAQKLDGNGNLLWQTGGAPVCLASGSQEQPLVRTGANYSFIVWGDIRSGSIGIWHQKLDDAGAAQLAADGDTLIWGLAGNAENSALVQNDLGEIFAFFQDLRNGPAGYAIYLQVLDTLGNRHLNENGIPVCPNVTYNTSKNQEWVAACSDGDNGAIAVWRDHRDSSTEGVLIVGQRVDAQGNRYWGDAGLTIGDHAGEQEKPKIAPDGSGGAFVAWQSFAPDWSLDVFVAHVSHAGAVDWTVQITNVAGEDEVVNAIAADGNGGVYLTYRGGLGDEGTFFDVYAQHVDAAGNLTWGSGNLTLCNLDGIQRYSNVLNLGGEGALFIWEDQRSGAGEDLYVQKVSIAGVPQWEANGRALCTEIGDQKSADLALDGQGNCFIVWEDFRGGQHLDIYLQKLSPDGQKLFAAQGLEVCTATGEQSDAHVLADGSGGVYLCWDDYRNAPDLDIYGVHLDDNGDLAGAAWAENGSIINDFFQKQNHALLSSDYAGGAISVWQDKRSSGKEEVIGLYAQRFNEYVTGIGAERPTALTPLDFRLDAPHPNPFNPSVEISFSLPRAGSVDLAVYDALGRRFAELKRGWQPIGSQSLNWNAGNAASGLYFVRLEFENRRVQQKLLLIK